MIKFELSHKQKVKIIKDGTVIGHIFSPAGSGETTDNAIQICGFSEAFDLWGCAVFKGFKDIQLLFDNKIMSGKTDFEELDITVDCIKCYRKPCQCENKEGMHPFNVKRATHIIKRLDIVKPMNEEDINKIPIKDRTNKQHHWMIKNIHSNKITDYLLSMGKFKDVDIDID